MDVKEILKNLEKLKGNEVKIKYLNEILKKIEDKDLIEEIKELIQELEDNLESKIEDVIIPASRRRKMELDEVESDIETQGRQVVRQRQLPRQQIILPRDEEDKETRYNIAPRYETKTQQTYQTAQLFTTYENMSQQSQTNARLIEEVLIKERDFDIGNAISENQREEIRDTIDKFMPNASVEERIKTEQQVFYDMKLKDKNLKYIAKLR
ncbi:MAG: hypothetical protein AABW56_01330 [Nanoarchaeota archaeon]